MKLFLVLVLGCHLLHLASATRSKRDSDSDSDSESEEDRHRHRHRHRQHKHHRHHHESGSSSSEEHEHHEHVEICRKIVILMDAPVPADGLTVNGCAGCQYLELTQDNYDDIPTLGLGPNDILVLIPTSTTTPTPNALTLAADIATLTTIAAQTNLYLMTSVNPVTNPGTAVSNNLLIMGLGTIVPGLHVLDFFAYFLASPVGTNLVDLSAAAEKAFYAFMSALSALQAAQDAFNVAAAVADPCPFLKSTPGTLSGKCDRPSSIKVVILTDDTPPYPNPDTSCIGSCFFYPTSMYSSIETLHLEEKDVLILMPTASSHVTTSDLIADKSHLLHLARETNVLVFTSPGAANAASNDMILDVIKHHFERVIVKDYASYKCPLLTANPPRNCACNYIGNGFGEKHRKHKHGG